jgi:hypothetical protein
LSDAVAEPAIDAVRPVRDEIEVRVRALLTVTEVRWEAPMPYVEYGIDWFEGLIYETGDTHWDESQIAAV